MIDGLLDVLDGGAGKKAQGMTEEMYRQAQSIPLPILKEYYPELYKQVAEINPELETAVNLGPSEMNGIATDPSLRQAQMNALNKLQEVGNAGGRDAQFLSDASRLENDVNTNLQGQTGAITQNMAARGMSGGGSEMVAKQMATQGAANRQSQMGLDLNAQAQQRALQALMQSGQMGGQMQQQDFSQQASKAQATDAINRFNAQNQQNVIGNNVADRNQAQQYNAGMAQDISNQNASTRNQAQQYNSNLAQRDFDNRMSRQTGVASAGGQVAEGYRNQSNNTRQFVGGLISAGAMYGGGMPKGAK